MENTQPSLRLLSKEQIAKAFEKTKNELSVPGGELVLISEENCLGALDVAKSCFVDDEPLGLGVGITWTKEFEDLFIDTFKQGLSVMMVDPESGDVMGIRSVRTMFKGDAFDLASIKDAAMRKEFEFIEAMNMEVNVFETYGIDELIQFLGLGVSAKYRRRGFGATLMQAGVKLASNLGIEPIYIKGEGSSNYSQRIYEKLGFKTLFTKKFEDYKVDGEVVFKNTGEHKNTKGYLMRVSKDEKIV
ncbi:arylalkylamine N-acetyltransferase 1-like [Mya arenaria]|uniref:arylalkylamine N-acetyltransferase 1-like n=1 Tax=Mya arenaria TaxID=6604 RepID=UPI0022E43DE5|nr:arylalkylamine N-acetyltransferase 1-like [Mya arenaria]